VTTLNDSYGYGTKLNTFLWLRIQFSASFTVAGHAIRVNEAFYGCERFFMRFHSYSQLWPSIMHLWEPLAGKTFILQLWNQSAVYFLRLRDMPAKFMESFTFVVNYSFVCMYACSAY